LLPFVFAFVTGNFSPTCFQWCNGADSNDPPGCQLKPLELNESPLWIYSGGWDSIDAAGTTIKILARELLGFTNIYQEYGPWEHGKEPIQAMGGPTGNKVCPKATHKADETGPRGKLGKTSDWPCFRTLDAGLPSEVLTGPDVFPEHWPSGYEQIVSDMVFGEGTVLDKGAIGYFGQNGLYMVGGGAAKYSVSALEFWKSYNYPEQVKLLPNRTTTQAFNYRGMSGGKFACQHAWCTNGRYTPPQCINNPLCKDVVYRKDNWATAQIEQIVKNLNLNFTVVWAGGQTTTIEAEQSKKGEPTLMYDFTPTRTVAQLEVQRVTLPPYNATEYAPEAPGRYTNLGIIASDFPAQVMGKFVSKRLEKVAPAVAELVQRINLPQADMTAMLKKLPTPGVSCPYNNDVRGNPHTFKCMETAMCTWLKANTRVWQSWIPSPKCAKGSIYEAATHQCKACTGKEIAPVAGRTQCEACPGDKVTKDGVTCVEPDCELALDLGQLIGLIIGLVIAWCALTLPPVVRLVSLGGQTTTLLSDLIIEGTLDGMELSAAALIVSGFSTDMQTSQVAQIPLIAIMIISILLNDSYTAYFVFTVTKEGAFDALETMRSRMQGFTNIIVIPLTALEIDLYLNPESGECGQSITDFICVVVLAIDIGVRLKGPVIRDSIVTILRLCGQTADTSKPSESLPPSDSTIKTGDDEVDKTAVEMPVIDVETPNTTQRQCC
jgi:hypothetical protein